MLDGLNDPNRQTFYNSLLLSAYTLADKTVECLLEKESTALYYQKKRYYKTRPEETIQTALDEVDKATGDLSLKPKMNYLFVFGVIIRLRSGIIRHSKKDYRPHVSPTKRWF